MDLSKLKNRPSYPFETIAVAVGFSPRLEAILSETKRLNEAIGARLIFIHVGEKTREKEHQLEALIDKLEFDRNNLRVIFMDGEPVETILSLCKLNIVDLLVLGALEKENVLKYYLGSVARSICRRAKCSVVLLTKPSTEANKFRKIVVNGVDNKKTIHTIKTAVYLAKRTKVKEITVVNEINNPALAMSMADSSTAPEATKIKKEIEETQNNRLHEVIEKCKIAEISFTEKNVKGKPGFAISKYARDKKADLLIINSPDQQLNVFDRIFTHDIEYILADLPCNLMIVHSRV